MPAPKPAALSELDYAYPGEVTQGPAARTLNSTLASDDESVIDLLEGLRAALSGSGPALLLHGPADRIDPFGARIELLGADDDPADPTAVAVITSGSSGAAKTVLLPASALLASAAATHDRLGGSGHWLLALPAQHVAGLQVLIRSLIAGTRPTALDLSAGFTPEGFTEAAGRMPAGRPGTHRYTALVPTQLRRLLAAPGEAGAQAVEALRRFDAVLLGGAATGPELRDQAEAAGVRVVTSYGMSETCGGCVYDGVPLDGVSVRIDDAEPGDGGGRVRLGGPMVARGYLGPPARPGATDAPAGAGPRFGTEPAFSTDPDGRRWFRTDDAGVLEPPQPPGRPPRLRILGRLDTVIVSGGVNISPGPVELALERLPQVAEAVVVGLPDPVWGERVAAALVLAPGAGAPSLAQVRALISAEVSGPAAPRQLTVLQNVPLSGPGKPDRAAIVRTLLQQPPLEGL